MRVQAVWMSAQAEACGSLRLPQRADAIQNEPWTTTNMCLLTHATFAESVTHHGSDVAPQKHPYGLFCACVQMNDSL